MSRTAPTATEMRERRRAVAADRERLEGLHGAELDAMEPADVERLAGFLFRDPAAGDMARRVAPRMWRAALVAALATGGPDL
ncbi:hypothetical protein Pla123a_28870 [Posidoniimonas polymericola]|uniref:Uncharacterized protein n=1 Tax=Posidoniimonas polymericola TaxID=2528002 RepID=A0A5C5YMT6_9BACT|nr:hypothetical protein [Posidoniimonas polymericola]TWT76098.1 hypothetical protein Pla123a_28870 [Posidoniimonas polymericola]